MAKRRIAMHRIREIIRLKEKLNLSDRAISRALNVSRPVVSQYIKEIKKAGDLPSSYPRELPAFLFSPVYLISEIIRHDILVFSYQLRPVFR